MQDISKANEMNHTSNALPAAQTAAESLCDCQSSENLAGDMMGDESHAQCTDGVCSLDWKPMRPAA